MADQFGMPLVDHRPSHEVIAELRDQLTAAQAREAELMADNARLREALQWIAAQKASGAIQVKAIEALAKVRKP